MLKKFSELIVDGQIEKKILKTDEREVYIYAYELLLNQVINMSITLFIAIIFDNIVSVLLFLICYIPMRTYSGGYHAKTNWGCTVISSLIVIGVCWSINAVNDQLLLWYPVVFGVSGYCIFQFAPVADINKPLEKKEIIRYSAKSRRIWIFEVFIGLFLYFINRRIGSVVAIVHLDLCVMLILGIIKSMHMEKVNKRGKL